MPSGQTLANAATAASGAMASAGAIPVVGWILAPIVGAAVYAAAIGFSAKEGFDVPRGLNPQTQLHGGEMVLPQPLADVIRGLADNKSNDRVSRSGGGGITINTSNIDARSMRRALQDGGVLHKSIKDLHRRMAR